jgi:RHS repeat-associated protein
VNGATNQLSSALYDANGNMTSGSGATLTYDEANRVASARTTVGGSLTEYYGYAPDNKRIYRLKTNGVEEWTFYGAHGEKLYGAMQMNWHGIWNSNGTIETGVALYFYGGQKNVWFAGRLLFEGTSPVIQDRLGTNRTSGARFYPYGGEITSTANDRTKFATYTRDGFTGLDYAQNRYFASTYGSFVTPDPSVDNVDPSGPLSWNAYSYAEGDPINFNDPEGLAKCSDWYDTFTGKTFGSEITAKNDAALLGRVDWAESDGGQYNGFQTQNYFDEKAAVAVSIVNRMDILNYKILVSNGNGGYINPGTLGWGPVNATLTQVLSAPGQYASVRGGDLMAAFQTSMNKVLAEDATSHDCVSLVNSYQAGVYALEHILADPFGSEGVTTSFHHGTTTGSIEPYFGTFKSPNNFFGIPNSNAVYNPSGQPPPAPPRRRPVPLPPIRRRPAQ